MLINAGEKQECSPTLEIHLLIISGAVQSFLWLIRAKVHRNFFFLIQSMSFFFPSYVGLLGVVITSALVVSASRFLVRNMSQSFQGSNLATPRGRILVTAPNIPPPPPPSHTTQGVGYMLQCLNS